VLLQAAQRFAHGTAVNPRRSARIAELFIREEQRHAALLRAFMEDHHIALKKDRLDRSGFFVLYGDSRVWELYIYILISAELIGIVYYRATRSGHGLPAPEGGSAVASCPMSSPTCWIRNRSCYSRCERAGAAPVAGP